MCALCINIWNSRLFGLFCSQIRNAVSWNNKTKYVTKYEKWDDAYVNVTDDNSSAAVMLQALQATVYMFICLSNISRVMTCNYVHTFALLPVKILCTYISHMYALIIHPLLIHCQYHCWHYVSTGSDLLLHVHIVYDILHLVCNN